MKPEFDKIWFANNSKGLIQKEEGYELYNIAIELPEGSLIVEIGSYEGKSSSVLASVADKNNLRLICVDPLVDFPNGCVPTTKETRRIFIKNIMNVFKNVEWIDAPTTEESSALVQEEIDFMFIDGDHSYEGVKEDCEHWLPKLKSGGLVTFHDHQNVAFWGVAKAVKEYCVGWENVSAVWNQATFRKP